MIKLKELNIEFGSRKLLNVVSGIFSRGELTALIGRNGSGKSTLLRSICGFFTNYSGEIQIEGKNIRDLSKLQMAKKISFVTTERPRIANLSCRDIVSLGRSPYTDWMGRLLKTDKEIIDDALESVGMLALADRSMDNLSDGECQRIMIARAIAQDTPAIILDEPTSFLDLANRYEVVTLLKKLANQRNKSIIFSTHELDIALDKADKIALIDDEKLIHKNVEEMIKSGLIQKMFHSSGDYINRLLNMILESRK